MVRPGTGGALEGISIALSAASEQPVATTPTDTDGAFVFDGLVGGASYEFFALEESLLPGYAGPMRATVDVPVDVPLVLRAGRFIDVRVLSEVGAPISEARVWGSEQEPDAEQHLAAALAKARRRDKDRNRTDKAGTLRIGPFANVPVSVFVKAEGFLDDWKRDASALSAPGEISTMSELTREARIVPVGTDTVEVRLRRGLSVSGCVVDEYGKAVAKVLVQAQRRSTWRNGGSLIGFESVWTDTDGKFTLDGMPAGRLTIVARTWKPLRQTEIEVEAGTHEIILTLGAQAASGVALTIVDPDGKLVPMVTVHVSPFVPLEAVGGRIDLDIDPPFGETEIEVVDPRDEAGHALPLAANRVTWSKGDSRTLEVRLERETPIAGRVLDPDGKGVEGVLLTASNVTESATASDQPRRFMRQSKSRAMSRTDAAGTFRIGGLAAGSYLVAIKVPDAYLTPPPLHAKGGDDSVDFRLRVGIRPVVRVVDWQGAPVVGARVRLSAMNANDTTGLAEEVAAALLGQRSRTDAGGAVLLPKLDPHWLIGLSIDPPRDRSDLRSFAREGWKPRDEMFTLAQGWSVRGTVRDLDGRPVSGSIVRATAATGEIRTSFASEDGSFVVADLPAGPVQLVASLGHEAIIGESQPAGPALSTSSGTHDVVLIVDRGVSLRVRIENVPATATDVEAMLVPEGADATGFAHPGRFEASSLHFVGLRPDRRYALWIAPTEVAPDLSLWQSGVRGDVGEIRVRLVAGRTVRGRIILPAGSWEASAAATRGLAQCEAKTSQDGRFEIRGVPPGTWKFEGLAWHETAYLVGEATATGEDDVEIHVAPAPSLR